VVDTRTSNLNQLKPFYLFSGLLSKATTFLIATHTMADKTVYRASTFAPVNIAVIK
jgi:hypothetical protein